MKKTLLALIMGIIMIGFASCGGNNNGKSKAFNQATKIIDDIMESVEKAQTCDDVDMAAFGILALFGVDGLEDMPQAEQDEFSKYSEKLDEVMAKKKAELNCPEDESWFDDEDVPVDEEVEVEE